LPADGRPRLRNRLFAGAHAVRAPRLLYVRVGMRALLPRAARVPGC